MTLAAQITADVAAVFQSTDDFAETIVHYPAGVIASATNVIAVVDYDTLEALQDEAGKITQRALLEIPIGTTVTVTRGMENASTWSINSAVWVTKDIVGKDHAMQLVEVWKVDQKHTQRAN